MVKYNKGVEKMDDMFIHKLIEDQEPEAKRRMWEKIATELNLPAKQTSTSGQTSEPVRGNGKNNFGKNKRRE